MNKRIFRSMGALILLTVLAFALLWGGVFSGQLGAQIKEGLKTLRVSIINEDGTVVFDNMADATALENHLQRPEVSEAMQSGAGESERFSNTLDGKTYYYAARLAGGDILRLAMTADSLTGIFTQSIPIVLGCLLLAAGFAFIAAKRLTKRITSPINSMNLDAPVLNGYEELLPFLKKIETQKKELSAQLSEIEIRTATISAITENMKEGLLLLDENGTVLLANGSILRILDSDGAVGRNMVEICRDASFMEHAAACLAGEKAEAVLRIDGKFYDVLFNPALEEDTISGAVVLFIDITERYAAETQRKEFSANVSHELKTPLTTISGLSEMIANGTAKESDVRPFADKINKQSGRLINIIDDIIKLSEFDEETVPRAFIRCNLHDLAQAVIDSLQEKAAERGIRIELHGDPGIGITANARMMDELLYNLVDNAIKYNRDGGSITVSFTQSENETLISVADQGIGIPKEHIGRIFERFYRVDKSRSKKTGGTGLGLSIVKHVAEFHGGRVEVQSEEGVGTVFTCALA